MPSPLGVNSPPPISTAGEQVLVDGQGDCVAGTVHLGCGVAWIDLLAQYFRSALALKEGAESGVVLKNGGGEVQFDCAR